MPRKVIAFLISFCLIFEQAGFAQVAPQLGVPAYLNQFAPVADAFRPVHLRALTLQPQTNDFDLLLDKGDSKDLKPPEIQSNAQKLLEYFRIGLALPNDAFWVNLRPDAPADIIDPDVEKTDIGRIFLEADLQLKKDMARFTSPETPEGRQYWDKLYARAEEIFGPTDISIPTITRPWIVPGEIIVGESADGAYIYKATLKVMLEQDYLQGSVEYSFEDERLKQLNDYSSEILRQLIIPKLTREVNAAKRYAPLRQVYYSLILAQWFKEKFSSRGSHVARHTSQEESNPLLLSIDSKDLTGLTSQKKWKTQTYYKAYQKSFKNGEYSLDETVYNAYGMTVRRYFSGGLDMDASRAIIAPVTANIFGVISKSSGQLLPSLVRASFDGGTIRLSDTPLSTSLPEQETPADVTGSSPAALDGGKAVDFLTRVNKFFLQLTSRFFRRQPRDDLISKRNYLLAIKGKISAELLSDAEYAQGALNTALLQYVGTKVSDVPLATVEEQMRNFILSHILAKKFPELKDFNHFPFLKDFNSRFNEEYFFYTDLWALEKSMSGVPLLVLFDPETTVAYAVPVNTLGYTKEEIFPHSLTELFKTIESEVQKRLILRVGWGNGEGFRGFFLVEDTTDSDGTVVSRNVIDFKGYTPTAIDTSNRHRGADHYDPTGVLSSTPGENEEKNLPVMKRIEARFTQILFMKATGENYGQLYRKKSQGSPSKLPYAGGVLRLTDLGRLAEKEAQEHNIEKIMRFLTTPNQFEYLFPQAEGGFSLDRFLFLIGQNLGQQLGILHSRRIFNIGVYGEGRKIGAESELHIGNIDLFGNILDRSLENQYESLRQRYTESKMRQIDISRMLVGMGMNEPGVMDPGFLGYTEQADLREAFLRGLLKGYLPNSAIDPAGYTDVMNNLNPLYKLAFFVLRTTWERLPDPLRKFVPGSIYYFWEKARSRYMLPQRMAEEFPSPGLARKDGGDPEKKMSQAEFEDLYRQFLETYGNDKQTAFTLADRMVKEAMGQEFSLPAELAQAIAVAHEEHEKDQAVDKHNSVAALARFFVLNGFLYKSSGLTMGFNEYYTVINSAGRPAYALSTLSKFFMLKLDEKNLLRLFEIIRTVTPRPNLVDNDSLMYLNDVAGNPITAANPAEMIELLWKAAMNVSEQNDGKRWGKILRGYRGLVMLLEALTKYGRAFSPEIRDTVACLYEQEAHEAMQPFSLLVRDIPWRTLDHSSGTFKETGVDFIPLYKLIMAIAEAKVSDAETLVEMIYQLFQEWISGARVKECLAGFDALFRKILAQDPERAAVRFRLVNVLFNRDSSLTTKNYAAVLDKLDRLYFGGLPLDQRLELLVELFGISDAFDQRGHTDIVFVEIKGQEREAVPILVNILEESPENKREYSDWTRSYLMKVLIQIADAEGWADVFVQHGKVDQEQRALARLYISSIFAFYASKTESATKMLLSIHEGSPDASGLNIFEHFMLSKVTLSDTAREKLLQFFKTEGTNVKRQQAFKALLELHQDSDAHKTLSDVIDHASSQLFLQSLSFLPTAIDLYKRGHVSEEELKAAVASGDLAGRITRLLGGRIKDIFELTFDAENIHPDAQNALSDSRFLEDIFNFDKTYKDKVAARDILRNLLQAYFTRGMTGIMEYKFSRQRHLNSRQAPEEIQKRLQQAGMITVTVGQAAESQASFFDRFFRTTLENYKNHRAEFKFDPQKFLQESQEAKDKWEREFAGLKAAIKPDSVLAVILAGTPGQKMIEDLKSAQGLSNPENKQRGMAIMLLTRLLALYELEKILGEAEQIIRKIEALEQNREQEEAARKIYEEHQQSLPELKNGLESLHKQWIREEKPHAQLAAEMLGLLEALGQSLKPQPKKTETVTAQVSYDLKEAIKIGRYGSSGQGNCQNSNSVTYNHSLMSFIGDPHESIVLFRNGDNAVIGFALFHGVFLGSGEFAFIKERVYTNIDAQYQEEASRKIAEEISSQIGVPVLDPYSNAAKQKVVVTMPASYVSRYLDFTRSDRPAAEQKDIQIEAELILSPAQQAQADGGEEELKAEFDSIFGKKIAEIAIPEDLAQRLASEEIVRTMLLDDGPDNGSVYHAQCASGNELLFLLDNRNRIIGLYFSHSRVGFGRTVNETNTALEISSEYTALPQSVFSLFEDKIALMRGQAEDKRLEFGSGRYTDELKAKLFLPLINPYHDINKLRETFIDNAIIRNFVRNLGAEIITAFSGTIKMRSGRFRQAAGISFGGHTWYHMHVYRVMQSFPLYYSDLVAHEFAHEHFNSVKAKDALRNHFLNERKKLGDIIKNNPAYAQNEGNLLLTEMIAFVVGAIAGGYVQVNIQDGDLNYQSEAIKDSDIDILVDHGFLPAEFALLPKERARFEQNSGHIDYEYLSRVYPKAAKFRVEQTEKAANSAVAEQIMQSVHWSTIVEELKETGEWLSGELKEYFEENRKREENLFSEVSTSFLVTPPGPFLFSKEIIQKLITPYSKDLENMPIILRDVMVREASLNWENLSLRLGAENTSSRVRRILDLREFLRRWRKNRDSIADTQKDGGTAIEQITRDLAGYKGKIAEAFYRETPDGKFYHWKANGDALALDSGLIQQDIETHQLRHPGEFFVSSQLLSLGNRIRERSGWGPIVGNRFGWFVLLESSEKEKAMEFAKAALSRLEREHVQRTAQNEIPVKQDGGSVLEQCPGQELAKIVKALADPDIKSSQSIKLIDTRTNRSAEISFDPAHSTVRLYDGRGGSPELFSYEAKALRTFADKTLKPIRGGPAQSLMDILKNKGWTFPDTFAESAFPEASFLIVENPKTKIREISIRTSRIATLIINEDGTVDKEIQGDADPGYPDNTYARLAGGHAHPRDLYEVSLTDLDSSLIPEVKKYGQARTMVILIVAKDKQSKSHIYTAEYTLKSQFVEEFAAELAKRTEVPYDLLGNSRYFRLGFSEFIQEGAGYRIKPYVPEGNNIFEELYGSDAARQDGGALSPAVTMEEKQARFTDSHIFRASTNDAYIRQIAKKLARSNGTKEDDEYKALKDIFNNDRRKEYLVYVEDGEVQGFITCYIESGHSYLENKNGNYKLSVMDILVFPEYRGRNTGRSLWLAAKEYAQSNHLYTIVVKAILDPGGFWRLIFEDELKQGVAVDYNGEGTIATVYVSKEEWKAERLHHHRRMLYAEYWSVKDGERFDNMYSAAQKEKEVDLDMYDADVLLIALVFPLESVRQEAELIFHKLSFDSRERLRQIVEKPDEYGYYEQRKKDIHGARILLDKGASDERFTSEYWQRKDLSYVYWGPASRNAFNKMYQLTEESERAGTTIDITEFQEGVLLEGLAFPLESVRQDAESIVKRLSPQSRSKIVQKAQKLYEASSEKRLIEGSLRLLEFLKISRDTIIVSDRQELGLLLAKMPDGSVKTFIEAFSASIDPVRERIRELMEKHSARDLGLDTEAPRGLSRMISEEIFREYWASKVSSAYLLSSKQVETAKDGQKHTMLIFQIEKKMVIVDYLPAQVNSLSDKEFVLIIASNSHGWPQTPRDWKRHYGPNWTIEEKLSLNQKDGGIGQIHLYRGDVLVLTGETEENMGREKAILARVHRMHLGAKNIIWLDAEKGQGYQPSFDREFLEKLMASPDMVKSALGIQEKAALREVLDANYIIIEERLISMDDQGKVFFDMIDSAVLKQISWLRGAERSLSRHRSFDLQQEIAQMRKFLKASLDNTRNLAFQKREDEKSARENGGFAAPSGGEKNRPLPPGQTRFDGGGNDGGIKKVQAVAPGNKIIVIATDPTIEQILDEAEKRGLSIAFVGGTARRMIVGNSPITGFSDVDIAILAGNYDKADGLKSYCKTTLKIKVDILNYTAGDQWVEPYVNFKNIYSNVAGLQNVTINRLSVSRGKEGAWLVNDETQSGAYIQDVLDKKLRLLPVQEKDTLNSHINLEALLRIARIIAEYPDWEVDRDLQQVLSETVISGYRKIFILNMINEFFVSEQRQSVFRHIIQGFLKVFVHAGNEDDAINALRRIGPPSSSLADLFGNIFDLEKTAKATTAHKTAVNEEASLYETLRRTGAIRELSDEWDIHRETERESEKKKGDRSKRIYREVFFKNGSEFHSVEIEAAGDFSYVNEDICDFGFSSKEAMIEFERKVLNQKDIIAKIDSVAGKIRSLEINLHNLKYEGEFMSEQGRKNLKETISSIRAALEKERNGLAEVIKSKAKDGGVQKDTTGKGGIDLRRLPIVTQPAVGAAPGVIPGGMPTINIADLDKEWIQIQKQMQKETMPYVKIKEYVACCKQQNAQEQLDAVLACIATILRLEEERVVPTAPELKEILVSIG